MKKYAEYLVDTMSKRDCEIQAVTAKMDTPFLSMAEAISDKFGETRISVLQVVIEQGLTQLFYSFDDDIKSILAESADKKTTDFMLSKGAKIRSHNVFGEFENEWQDWKFKLYDFQLSSLIDEIRKEQPELEEFEVIKLAHSRIKVEVSK